MLLQVQVPYTHGNQTRVVYRQKLQSLQIFVKDTGHKLEYGVDESYALDIPANSKSAILRSKTVWGALRGLETFSQLIQSRPVRDEDNKIIYYEDDEDFDQSDYGFENLYIPEVPIRIRDTPKYSHRGLMLGNKNKQE